MEATESVRQRRRTRSPTLLLSFLGFGVHRNYYWEWNVNTQEWQNVSLGTNIDGTSKYNLFFRDYNQEVDVGYQFGVKYVPSPPPLSRASEHTHTHTHTQCLHNSQRFA
eukprot:1196078-Prorocentrum_minimum.AAC.1